MEVPESLTENKGLTGAGVSSQAVSLRDQDGRKRPTRNADFRNPRARPITGGRRGDAGELPASEAFSKDTVGDARRDRDRRRSGWPLSTARGAARFPAPSATAIAEASRSIRHAAGAPRSGPRRSSRSRAEARPDPRPMSPGAPGEGAARRGGHRECPTGREEAGHGGLERLHVPDLSSRRHGEFERLDPRHLPDPKDLMIAAITTWSRRCGDACDRPA
jgi:hypothetical protein